MSAGGDKKQPTRDDWLILIGLVVIIFAMLAIWTAPLPTSSKAGFTALVFLGAGAVVYAGGRR